MTRKECDDDRYRDMHSSALKAYSETLELRNYSPNTIKNYRNHFEAFLSSYRQYRPSEITKKQITDYLVDAIKLRKVSASEINQIVNAVKFFYEKVLNRPKAVYDLPRAKKPFQLPGIFSEKEVKAILDAAGNLKHKCILCVAYAGGLRVSEIISLKIADIDSERMVINIRQSKGRKDRIVMLSQKLLSIMREYYKAYKPKDYLFEGQHGGRYSSRSI